MFPIAVPWAIPTDQCRGIAQVGKFAEIYCLLVKIFASCPSLLDLSLPDVLCTFHLIGGRLGKMTRFGQCKGSGSDALATSKHKVKDMCGSTISHFSLPQEHQYAF